MLSYRDWNEYADMLADTFAGRGLGRDDVVAVRCRNRLEWAVIALACAKIDARLLTLDADLPPAALRDRLIAGRAVALIAGDVSPIRLSQAVEGLPLRLKASMDGAVGGFYSFWDLFPPVAPPRFGGAQPVLMGWTARAERSAAPIGVPRRRAAPASLSRPPVPEIGVSLITLPLHRVWAPVQFWTALIAGRGIALMREYSPAAALDVIEKRRVTHWTALPEMFAELQAFGIDAERRYAMRSIRELVVGGAAAPEALRRWLAETFPTILCEAYGSPETGLIAWMAPQQRASRPDSCGRALRGVSVEVRDLDGRRLPKGAIGQIWARTQRSIECELPGAGNHDRRDADGFVATGDAGRIDEDGYIYLTGRASMLAKTDLRRAG